VLHANEAIVLNVARLLPLMFAMCVSALAQTPAPSEAQRKFNVAPQGFEARREGIERGTVERTKYDSKTLGIRRPAIAGWWDSLDGLEEVWHTAWLHTECALAKLGIELPVEKSWAYWKRAGKNLNIRELDPVAVATAIRESIR